jgi:hypothetical protein
VSWKNLTERWTQKQPPQRTEESVFLGGPIPIGKVGKIEKMEEFEITFTKKRGNDSFWRNGKWQFVMDNLSYQ